jgi:hypothetical protein
MWSDKFDPTVHSYQWFGDNVCVHLFLQIIFLSTLFYLLSHSKHKYLPVEGILSLMPQQQGDPHQSSIMKAGDALTRAYRSVFLVTFKMALFYGLYTWFVHKLFFIEAAILPAG